jgi:hypothetical protein
MRKKNRNMQTWRPVFSQSEHMGHIGEDGEDSKYVSYYFTVPALCVPRLTKVAEVGSHG